MRNVVMIRREAGLVAIPVEKLSIAKTAKQSRLRLGSAVDSADRSRSLDWFP